MKSTIVSVFLTIILTIISCKSENDISPVNNCLPVSLRTSSWYTDSLVFEYNAARKLNRILSYTGSTLYDISDFEYDDSGRMIRYHSHNASVSAPPGAIFEFHYGTNGKIAYRTYTNNPAIEPRLSLTYTYDDQGRLVKKRSEPDGAESRFEYNSDDNIVRSYFKDIDSEVEVLGRENHTFDNSMPFYANSKELTTWAVYCANWPPNRNNVLTSSISKEGPNAFILPVRNFIHKLEYDNNGLVRTDSNQSGVETIIEFYFEDATYDCK